MKFYLKCGEDRYDIGMRTKIFGRSKGDFTFPEDKTMSKEHFKIRVTGDVPLIVDLKAHNPTEVNHEKLISEVEVELKAGDVIEAGKTIFQVCIEGESVRHRDNLKLQTRVMKNPLLEKRKKVIEKNDKLLAESEVNISNIKKFVKKTLRKLKNK